MLLRLKSGLEVFNVEVAGFRPGAPAAGNGLENVNVEVVSFRPEPPAASSGFEALNVVRPPLPAVVSKF